MQELQAEILSWMGAVLFIIGFILILMAADFRESSQVILIGLFSYGLALMIFRLRKGHYLISAWILIIGLALIIFLIYSWMGIQ